MAVSIEARNADKLARIGRELRAAGNKGLHTELTKAIREATQPLRADVKAHALDALPRRGGLAKRVAKTRLTVRTKTGERDPSVRIRAGANAVRDPLRIDRGRARHPVFGRGPWVLQDVKKGWFTDPLVEGAPVVRPKIIAAMDDVARKIARTP